MSGVHCSCGSWVHADELYCEDCYIKQETPMALNHDLIEKYAHRMISHNAFHAIVASRLERRQSLSVVRMADGERQLFEDCAKAAREGRSDSPVETFGNKWLANMGIDGMTYHQLYTHMVNAMVNADYFCPSVSGLTHLSYNMFKWMEDVMPNLPAAKPLPDNFWTNALTVDQQVQLYKSAGKMICIHRNPVTANCLKRRAEKHLGVEVRHIQLAHWTQGEATVALASQHPDCPLVLASCGPASKWVIPQIARQGKVVLDLGNAMDHWLLFAVEQKAAQVK